MTMNVTSVFKPQGKDLRVLIVHSTKDDLGQSIVTTLRKGLTKKIVVKEERVARLACLATMPRPQDRFHVVLLIAHGDKDKNQLWLFGDVDAHKKDIATNAGVLGAALDGMIGDSLCLFGICHFGQGPLREAIVDQGGALACIAPKPGCTITKGDIETGFAVLLNELQARRHLDISIDDLDDILTDRLSAGLQQKLVVVTAAT